MILGALWIGGFAAAAAAWALLRGRRRSWIIRFGLASAVLLSILLTAGAIYRTWYLYRPQPGPLTKGLFEGVTYIREVQKEPWPMIAHIVLIDLRAPGLSFFATPGDNTAGHEFRAVRTSEFLTSHRLQLAVNAGFFMPFHSKSPWNYYPHTGDGVDVHGLGMSDGARTSARGSGYRSLAIFPGNDVRISDSVTTGEQVVSGLRYSLAADDFDEQAAPAQRQPRTAAALNATSDTLILVVVDGRQPNYSDGATMAELAEILRRHGGAVAINLDGGGSSTLAIENPRGSAEILNMPIHTHIPGRERPVATHLGIRAGRLDKE